VTTVTLALRRHGDAPPIPSGSSVRLPLVPVAAGAADGHYPAAVLDRDLGLVVLEKERFSSQLLGLTTNFPLPPSSRTKLRSSVLRTICGSRPLPMVPPEGAPEIIKTGSARLRQTGRWQYPQPSTRHQEIRHWLPVPASQSDHNQMRGLPNLQRTVGGVTAKTFFAHSHGGIAHFSRGVMCRDESRYRSV
jgi:hypothetical protein